MRWELEQRKLSLRAVGGSDCCRCSVLVVNITSRVSADFGVRSLSKWHEVEASQKRLVRATAASGSAQSWRIRRQLGADLGPGLDRCHCAAALVLDTKSRRVRRGVEQMEIALMSVIWVWCSPADFGAQSSAQFISNVVSSCWALLGTSTSSTCRTSYPSHHLLLSASLPGRIVGKTEGSSWKPFMAWEPSRPFSGAQRDAVQRRLLQTP